MRRSEFSLCSNTSYALIPEQESLALYVFCLGKNKSIFIFVKLSIYKNNLQCIFKQKSEKLYFIFINSQVISIEIYYFIKYL